QSVDVLVEQTFQRRSHQPTGVTAPQPDARAGRDRYGGEEVAEVGRLVKGRVRERAGNGSLRRHVPEVDPPVRDSETECDKRPAVAAEVDALDLRAPDVDRLADDAAADVRKLCGPVTRRDRDRLPVPAPRPSLRL